MAKQSRAHRGQAAADKGHAAAHRGHAAAKEQPGFAGVLERYFGLTEQAPTFARNSSPA